MKIIRAYPPNWTKIRAAFPGAIRWGAMFCYGDTIFNPSAGTISPSLLAHEEVHSQQQGRDPEAWWDMYIADRVFRLEEELEAHRRQFRVEAERASPRMRHKALAEIAGNLSSPLYGALVTRKRASELIAAVMA